MRPDGYSIEVWDRRRPVERFVARTERVAKETRPILVAKHRYSYAEVGPVKWVADVELDNERWRRAWDEAHPPPEVAQ